MTTAFHASVSSPALQEKRSCALHCLFPWMVALGSYGHMLCLDFLLYEKVSTPFFQGNERSVKSMNDGSDISRFHSCCCDSIFGFLIGVPQKKLRVSLDCLMASHVEVNRKWYYFCKFNLSYPVEYTRKLNFCYRGVAWGFIERKKPNKWKRSCRRKSCSLFIVFRVWPFKSPLNIRACSDLFPNLPAPRRLQIPAYWYLDEFFIGPRLINSNVCPCFS